MTTVKKQPFIKSTASFVKNNTVDSILAPIKSQHDKLGVLAGNLEVCIVAKEARIANLLEQVDELTTSIARDNEEIARADRIRDELRKLIG